MCMYFSKGTGDFTIKNIVHNGVCVFVYMHVHTYIRTCLPVASTLAPKLGIRFVPYHQFCLQKLTGGCPSGLPGRS